MGFQPPGCSARTDRRHRVRPTSGPTKRKDLPSGGVRAVDDFRLPSGRDSGLQISAAATSYESTHPRNHTTTQPRNPSHPLDPSRPALHFGFVPDDEVKPLLRGDLVVSHGAGGRVAGPAQHGAVCGRRVFRATRTPGPGPRRSVGVGPRASSPQHRGDAVLNTKAPRHEENSRILNPSIPPSPIAHPSSLCVLRTPWTRAGRHSTSVSCLTTRSSPSCAVTSS